MNPEILEQLLMDRSLNELKPEMEQLLDAYLADHPEHQPLVDSVEQTAMLGRMAVASQIPVKLPPFPKEKMLSCGQRTSWNLARQWLSIAASLVIGVGIGLSATLWRGQKAPEYAKAIPLPVQTRPELNGFKSAQAFWSPRTYMSLQESLRSVQEREANESKYQELFEKYRKRGSLWIEN